jgi:hypothetical protein
MVRESGKALVFNGKNQFVELPKDVADLRQCAYTVEFKWSGGAGDQRIFEFANAQGEFLCLCPSLKGKLTFAIRQGGKVEWVSAPGVPPDVWTRVQIVLEGSRATLSVNGKKVAEKKSMTLKPDSVGATECYLGRGVNGGYFNGMLDRFTIHVPSDGTPHTRGR